MKASPVKKIEIVNIGDRIFPGEYNLHSRFRRVVNFTDGERLVALVTEEVGRGPVNIVAKGLDPGLIDDTLRIDPGTVTINGEPSHFDREKIFHSHLGIGPVDSRRLMENLGSFEDALLELSPPGSMAFLIDEKREANFTSFFEQGFVERVKEGTQTIFGGPDRTAPDTNNIVSGVKKIKGLGFGLTPSGDDFISGLLVALNLMELIDGIERGELRERIVEVSRGGNLLSNSFISLAGDGYLFEGFKDMFSALIEGDKTAIRARTKNLLSLGASSGSDMAVGFLLTINYLLASLSA